MCLRMVLALLPLAISIPAIFLAHQTSGLSAWSFFSLLYAFCQRKRRGCCPRYRGRGRETSSMSRNSAGRAYARASAKRGSWACCNCMTKSREIQQVLCAQRVLKRVPIADVQAPRSWFAILQQAGVANIPLPYSGFSEENSTNRLFLFEGFCAHGRYHFPALGAF